jgi:hypothetical protein
VSPSRTSVPLHRRLRKALVATAAASTALFGLSGLATAATHPTTSHGSALQGTGPSGDSGTTIDPLQYNCGNDAPGCGQVGESYGYYNGTNVDLLYSENYYCDSNVSSGATSGCEVGAGPSGSPSATSSGGTGTSLGNTTHADTLYIPVPLYSPTPATQCTTGPTCIDHPPTIDLSRLGGPFSTATNVPIPAHDHVVTTRNSGLPEWWNVKVVPIANATDWQTFQSSGGKLTPTQISGAAGTNVFLFFQVLPGTVPAAQAANLTATAPPAQPAGSPTFNNLNNDCGQTAINCENIGIAHSWLGVTPGAKGSDVQALYSEQYFCGTAADGKGSGAATGCEAGAATSTLPPGVGGNGVIPTAANSYPGASATGNNQIDPLYIPVPIGFTPDYAQCPSVITCIDHPGTIDLSRLASALGAPASALTSVPLPSHDHVLTTRNGDQPEWWNVLVVPVTSQAALTAIETEKNLTLAQEQQAVDTNTFLWFQTLPGQSVATPGPVQATCSATLPAGGVVAGAALPDGTGYIETDAHGDVAVFGAATCYGSLSGTAINKPIVGLAVDRTTGGYWLVASDGGVFAFNAPFRGSTGADALNKPIVGIGTDINSAGYYLVASDGGVFAFGEPFNGSTGSLKLNKPVVGIAVDRAPGTNGTTGYWLVASDGGVFAFNAPFYGSTGSFALNKPVVALAPLSTGSGYREIAADGGVFSFNAPFFGSAGGLKLNQPVVSGANDNSSDGYWSFAADGGVFNYGTAFYGSAA